MCEIVHKINCLYKSPRLVDLSPTKKGKNEKDHYIHNNFDGIDSLLGVSGSEN